MFFNKNFSHKQKYYGTYNETVAAITLLQYAEWISKPQNVKLSIKVMWLKWSLEKLAFYRFEWNFIRNFENMVAFLALLSITLLYLASK